MGKGKKIQDGKGLRDTALAFAGLFILLPGLALSADMSAGSSSQIRQALRTEGAGPTWIPNPAMATPSSLELPWQSAVKKPEPPARIQEMGPRAVSEKYGILPRYDSAMARHVWYAVAAISAKAIAFVPGRGRQTSGLYIQKRAKLRGGQFGLARDVGAAQVTMGYLHTDHGRSELVPWSKARDRQNFAALTLSLKR